MKKFLSLIMGITMSMCLFTGCGNKEESKTEQTESKVEEVYEPSQYTVGTISDGVYKNESLRLKYTLVEDMKVLDDQTFKAVSDQMQKYMADQAVVQDVKLEFSAQDTNAENFSQIIIVSYKQDISDEDFTKKVTGNSAVEKVKICNMDFYKISNGMQAGSQHIQLVKKIGNNLIMIQVLAKSNEQVDKILSGFSKL